MDDINSFEKFFSITNSRKSTSENENILELEPVSFQDNFEKILKMEISEKHYFYEYFYLWFASDYYQLQRNTVFHLMKKDGILPLNWKYYIAIMAVSTMKSEHMLKSLEEVYLENDGDSSWLIFGIDIIPEKLKKIAKINNLLAHQPWGITINDFNVN